VQKAFSRAWLAEIRLGEASRRRHDEGVPALFVVLLAGLLLWLVRERSNGEPAPTPERKRSGGNGWWLLGALVLGVLLVRLGLNWLALAGGALFATLRILGPLLRLLPLASQWSQQRAAGGAGGNGAEAREAGGAARPARMSRHEALEVLGLDDRATREDVQREYRRLIKRLHPDLGGSTYLTAKLNEARDVLS
jgi:hypothetical protein